MKRYVSTMSLAGLFSVAVCTVFAEGKQIIYAYEQIPKISKEIGLNLDFRKHDVVLAGVTVTIDEELRTNGGNVFILADQLIINAPIDTRVYSVYNRYWTESNAPRTASLTSAFQYSPKALEPFTNYYSWHEHYNPGTKKYEYRTGTMSDLMAGRIAIPIMPSAPVPILRFPGDPWQNSPTDGPDAPSGYDRSAFRSGNINIHARVIKFCSDCVRKSYAFSKAPGGDLFDRERTVFLNAGGLKGGRGGRGTPFPCFFNSPPVRSGRYTFQADCVSHGMPNIAGGLEGRPGIGGDGGDVTVNIVGNENFYRHEWTEMLRHGVCEPNDHLMSVNSCFDGPEFAAKHGQSLVFLADTAAGVPAYYFQRRTPSFTVLSRSGDRLTGSLGAPPTMEERYKLDWTAKHGVFQINSESPELALASFGAALTEIDLNARYDLPSLFRSIAAQKTSAVSPVMEAYPVTSNSPIARSLITSFLAEILLARQLALLDRTEGDLRRETPRATNVSTDFLSELKCVGPPVGLTDVEAELIDRICDLSPIDGKDLTRSYFYRNGGLLSASLPLAVPNFPAEQLRAELVRSETSLKQILIEIQSLKGMFYDFTTNQQRDRFTEQISSLEKALEEANQALSARTNVLQVIASLASDAGKQAKAVAESWSASPPNFLALPGQVGQTLKSVSKLLSALNGEDLTAQQREAVAQIRAKLDDVKERFAVFVQATNELKKALLAEQLKSIQEYIDARQRLETMRRTFLFDFENMLRADVLMFATSPSDNGNLASAIRSQRDVLKRFPDQELMSLPPTPSLACDGRWSPALSTIAPRAIVGCATVFADPGRDYMISTTSSANLPDFPLLSVKRGNGKFPANFLGIYQRKEIVIK
ncbi:hypothetical protein AWB78_07146 [Caballeronia calidae]|uniref:Uncharacterized protein n=1 Tax=Caballeronia calidae TaxID=1777139 RepID=A0A158ED92_9BURK|nr:hypothetical protein [Caballeronia calidae]SAL04818.1 hypothetical protein AWB78_07146 [Caballeronia calidae]